MTKFSPSVLISTKLFEREATTSSPTGLPSTVAGMDSVG
jgi:hypothetical protein